MARLRSIYLTSNYPQLQNLIKRDAASYREEYLQQLNHFESSLSIFKLKPDEESSEFADLITFLAHVAPLFSQESKEFPKLLIGLLEEHYEVLDFGLRKAMVQGLILLRNKNFVNQAEIFSLFFKLFRCHDKVLRMILFNHIISDIKNSNTPHKNNKLNKSLQNFMYSMLQDPIAIAARKSLLVMIDLYRKQIWNDEKTVNVIAEACLKTDSKLVAIGLNFFLGKMDEALDEPESDEEGNPVRDIQLSCSVGGKSKAKDTRMKKALASLKRKEKKNSKVEKFNFSAIHLLNDPQGFVEKLFKKLSKSNDPFEIRLLLMNVISRLVGIHKLFLFQFYPFIIRYLQPHQKEVTLILTIAAQSSHDLIPPEEIEPMVMAIANNFVSDHCASEVMTVGLNSLREICARCPLAMNSTLLQDLANYKKYKDKGVMMGARSLIGLYREMNPTMLHKKDRGKTGAIISKEFVVPQYGSNQVVCGIEGTDKLGAMVDDEWEEASLDGIESADEWNEVDSEQDIELSVGSDAEENTAVEGILTDDDFKMLKSLKRTASQDSDDEEEELNEELVDLKKIEHQSKKRKQNYEERMESIKEGRENRQKYGSRKGKERGSSTNKEKEKKKNFLMIAHKQTVKNKSKLSMKQRIAAQRKHAEKQRKQK